MAGERDVLAEALHETLPQTAVSARWWHETAARALAALAARGWRVVPSAPEGAEPLPREALDVERLVRAMERAAMMPVGGLIPDVTRRNAKRIARYYAALSPDRPTPP